MKAFSLWQPWASLMASGAKTIETRDWGTRYRGPLLIHAAKHWSGEQERLTQSPEFRAGLERDGRGALPMPFGAALCVVYLDRCVQVEELGTDEPASTFQDMLGVRLPEDVEEIAERELDFGDYSPGRWLWITKGLRTFRHPVPMAGRQGLFAPPDSPLLQAMLADTVGFQ